MSLGKFFQNHEKKNLFDLNIMIIIKTKKEKNRREGKETIF